MDRDAATYADQRGRRYALVGGWPTYVTTCCGSAVLVGSWGPVCATCWIEVEPALVGTPLPAPGQPGYGAAVSC